jgi:hypothetical protein
MVQLIEEVDSELLTIADAMLHFGSDRSALRKRMARGVTAERVMANGEEMVRIIEID